MGSEQLQMAEVSRRLENEIPTDVRAVRNGNNRAASQVAGHPELRDLPPSYYSDFAAGSGRQTSARELRMPVDSGP